MKIALAISDHIVDANKTIAMPKSAEKPDHFAGVSKMVGSVFQSQRDCVHQPRVGAQRLPWVGCRNNFQPQRGCIVFAPMGCNPFRVDDFCFPVSQGSSFLATLGYRLESRWDSRTGARQARGLEQTIAGNVAEILEA